MAAKTQDAAASTGESSAKSDAVQVAVRVRPLSTSEASQGSKACVQVEDASILLAEKRFHFDAVFSATTQQEIVYTTLVAPMVDKFFCGYNATVFAYGQTGSGKTFTMGNDFGSSGARNDRGVIPRVIESVFEKINASRNSQHFVVKLSYLEILNEEIHDLFPKFSTDKLRQTLSVRGDVRTDEPHSNAISSLEEENRKLTEELCLAKEAKDKWKKIAEKLDAKLEKTVKELQDFKDQATKQKPAKKRIKRESYETMETFFSSSDEEDDNIQADPDYVSDEHRSTKRKKVNSTTSLTGDVMDEIDELLETSAASCCSCHGKCATKACACKSQSRVCSDTCSCNSENCRNRHMGDTPGGVNLHKGNADLAAPSTPTRPNAPEAFVSTGPAVGNDTAIDLMSP
ncbi:hypothetical protein Pcac1_g4047 [Phytophthora cactorum]|nr:hypothetical protein Pcac1_g4047 [Phytophthora cactorum]